MSPLNPHWAQPSHPGLFEVIHATPGTYTSLSKSLVSLPPGALIAHLGFPPLAYSKKAYSTVQVSRNQHIELNCDFLYINHSCEPSVEFHIVRSGDQNGDATNGIALNQNGHITNGSTDHHYQGDIAIEIRVANHNSKSSAGLNPGDELTFFYPSTEWSMAQPFDCNCGTKTCRKRIAGAKDMDRRDLEGFFLNEHILELLLEQEELEGKENGKGVAKGKRYGASARAMAGEMGGDTDEVGGV